MTNQDQSLDDNSGIKNGPYDPKYHSAGNTNTASLGFDSVFELSGACSHFL